MGQLEQQHNINWSFRLPSTFLIPPSLYKESETALIQPSHDSGTAKRVSNELSTVILLGDVGGVVLKAVLENRYW
jgi:hypothetical protein